MTVEMNSKLRNQLLLLLAVSLFLGILASCEGVSAVGRTKSQDGSSGPIRGNLTFTPSSEAFGSVLIGSTDSRDVTLTNNGEGKVLISRVTLEGNGFELRNGNSPFALDRSQSKTFTVTFAPQSAGNANGAVTIVSDASNPSLRLPLSGTGSMPGLLTTSAASLSFGDVIVGTSSSLYCTIRNAGGTSVTISQLLVAGLGFSIGDITTPLTLSPSQSTKLTVTFSPTSVAQSLGSITVKSSSSNSSLIIPFSGSGAAAAGQLSISPATIDLGSVVVGTSSRASASLTATGEDVTVTDAITNNSVFTVGGLTIPVTIGAGQSVPFTITFSPQITGLISGELAVISNAKLTTANALLTGRGIPLPRYEVTLAWDPSTSPNIAGYNLYRAVYSNTCGAFTKINPLPIPDTMYTDSAVESGISYCYAATALDSDDRESGDSNIVSNVQINNPKP
jgi:hypothetical protein